MVTYDLEVKNQNGNIELFFWRKKYYLGKKGKQKPS